MTDETLQTEYPSWSILCRKPLSVGTAIVVLGVGIPATNTFIASTIFPSAIQEIGGISFFAWVSTLYAVGSILGSAGSVVIVSHIDKRRALLLAITVFALGTVICALANSIATMLLGRIIQGLGGGMMIGGCYTLVGDLFPPSVRPQVFALISAAWGVAAVFGPLIGGVFAQAGIWRFAFWIVIPGVVPLIPLTLGHVKPELAEVDAAHWLPLGRLMLLSVAILTLGATANTSILTARVLLVLAATGCLYWTIAIDTRAKRRLFPSGAMKWRTTVGACFWLIFLLALATSPIGIFITLLMQVLHGLPPLAAGYFHAAEALSWTIAAVVGSNLKGGQIRTAIVTGPAVTTLGLVGLSTMIVTGPPTLTGISIMMVGGGIGVCWAHVSAIMVGGGKGDEGIVTATLIPTTQLVATALGGALAGIVANFDIAASGMSFAAAAHTGRWLYGLFVIAPMLAFAIAYQSAGLRPDQRAFSCE